MIIWCRAVSGRCVVLMSALTAERVVKEFGEAVTTNWTATTDQLSLEVRNGHSDPLTLLLRQAWEWDTCTGALSRIRDDALVARTSCDSPGALCKLHLVPLLHPRPLRHFLLQHCQTVRTRPCDAGPCHSSAPPFLLPPLCDVVPPSTACFCAASACDSGTVGGTAVRSFETPPTSLLS